MFKFSKSLVVLSVLAVSSAATADTKVHASYGVGANSVPNGYYHPPLAGGRLPSNSQWRFTSDGPSETAWFFHRRGERRFAEQNFEDAERAFEASLRAQGGTLRKSTLSYLARIAAQNGDVKKAQDYAADYALETGHQGVTE